MMPIYVLVGVAAFWFMEFVAWSNHKYLMHGRLWIWHKDHHRQDNKKAKTHFNNESNHFEKNDRLSIIYAIPAIILIGFAYQYPSLVAIGIGITVYGLTYFLIHDLIIHQRLPLLFYLKMKIVTSKQSKKNSFITSSSKNKNRLSQLRTTYFSIKVF